MTPSAGLMPCQVLPLPSWRQTAVARRVSPWHTLIKCQRYNRDHTVGQELLVFRVQGSHSRGPTEKEIFGRWSLQAGRRRWVGGPLPWMFVKPCVRVCGKKGEGARCLSCNKKLTVQIGYALVLIHKTGIPNTDIDRFPSLDFPLNFA